MMRAKVATEISKRTEDIVRAEQTVAFASRGWDLSHHTLGALTDLQQVIVGERLVLAALEKHRGSMSA